MKSILPRAPSRPRLLQTDHQRPKSYTSDGYVEAIAKVMRVFNFTEEGSVGTKGKVFSTMVQAVSANYGTAGRVTNAIDWQAGEKSWKAV